MEVSTVLERTEYEQSPRSPQPQSPAQRPNVSVSAATSSVSRVYDMSKWKIAFHYELKNVLVRREDGSMGYEMIYENIECMKGPACMNPVHGYGIYD